MKSTGLTLTKNYKNIFVLGSGNPSTTAFKLLESAKTNKLKIPTYFCSSGQIPSWVDSETLIIALSHSGNTIEVIDAVDFLSEKGYEVIAVKSGGRLKEKTADLKNIILLNYSADLLPRMAIGYVYVFLTAF